MTHQDEAERQARERYQLLTNARDKAGAGWKLVSTTTDANEIEDRVLRMQCRLIDHTISSASVSAIPHRLMGDALQVIGHLGITFGTEDSERAVEALGMLLVHISIIASAERLALPPIIELAGLFSLRSDVQPLHATGALALVVMSTRSPFVMPPPKDAYQLALVQALALSIARGLDDCVLGHELVIDLPELYLKIGSEVIAGTMPRREMPAELVIQAPDDVQLRDVESHTVEELALLRGAKRKVATEALGEALGELAKEQRDSDVPQPGRGARPSDRDLAQARLRVREADETYQFAQKVQSSCDMMVGEMLTDERCGVTPTVGGNRLYRYCASHLDLVERTGGTIYRDPVPGLAHDQICPQCAAPMTSDQRADLWRCSNGHEHTGKYLAALRGSMLPPTAKIDHPAPLRVKTGYGVTPNDHVAANRKLDDE